MKGIVLFIVFIFIVGCGPTPYFSEKYDLDPLSWSTDQKVSFQPTIKDTTSTYELQLIIDHKDTYSYENIYFRIKTTFPDRPEKEENLTVDLASKKGVWAGKCSGGDCKVKIFLLDNFKFPVEGEYGFELGQYTRDERLSGINSLQMELYKKG